jgi:hypothetical protein
VTFAPPRPNTRPVKPRPRKAEGHSDVCFCNVFCEVCEDRMSKRSAHIATSALAENFGPVGSRGWRTAYNAARSSK